MRWKKIETDNTQWKRVFVFWPKGTMDGFKVSFCHVWKKVYFSEEGALAPYKVVEYHTNPNGFEDEYQKKHDNITQVQIGGKNSQSIQSGGDLFINGTKRNLHSTEYFKPTRPTPPPAAPPPLRKISEDVKFEEVFD